MSVTSLYAAVRMGTGSITGEHCVLGYPKEQRLRAGSALRGEAVVVGERCLIFNGASAGFDPGVGLRGW